MSIASAITAAQGRVADAYTAISAKGGTLPATQNLTNMPTAIASIPSGPQYYSEYEKVNDALYGPAITKKETVVSLDGIDIIHNYAFAYVYARYYFTGSGTYGLDMSSLSSNYMNGIKRIYSYGALYAFYYATMPESFNMNSLISIQQYGFQGAFRQTKGLKYFSAPNCTYVTDYSCAYMFRESEIVTADFGDAHPDNLGSHCFYYTFYGCTRLTTVLLNGIKSQTGGANTFQRMCYGCIALTTVDLSSFSNIGNDSKFEYAFYNCTSLTTMNFTSFVRISGSKSFNNAFGNCTSLVSINFPSLTRVGTTNCFNAMLTGVTGCTIHFPKNLDPQTGSTVISSLTGYPNFGGTNTVLSFDFCPSTFVGTDTVTYYRNPKGDTATALAWRTDYNDIVTVAYTNTLNDPQAGDNVYSDDACTTVLTTIDRI